MQQLATRPWIAAGVALAGAGAIAVMPVTAPLPRAHVSAIQLTAAGDMVLDLVRHGQSADNVAGIMGTTPPGAPLTDLGKDQAVDVGQALYNGGANHIDGVYASEFLRTQQTAWPLIQLLQGHSDNGDIPNGPTPLLDPSQILPGLNELNGGILEGTQQSEFNGLLYMLAPLAWMLGQYWVPQLGSTTDINGMAFEDRFSGALDTIYNAGGATADGDLHDVAYSHMMAITVWTMMNVKNPDFGILLQGIENGGFLSNTGQVVIEGNPTDGWTLVSWDGVAVDQDPGLGTELFVAFRDLITAPQMAAWHIAQAIEGGDPTAISTAIQNGVEQIGAALLQFPESVYSDIVDALQEAGSAVAATAPGDVSAMIVDALG